MKSGFVSIIGRPNVGKSTLINSIITEKVAITSPISGTTRNLIQGIYNEPGYQIVFVDTPGIGKPLDKLGNYLNKEALSLTKDVDVILLVVDAASGVGSGDKYILETLKDSDIPVILILNKIDKLNKEQIIKTINEVKDYYSFSEIVPISALKNDNVDHLINVIKNYLHDSVKYYEDDEYTNSSLTFMVSEIVR